MKMKVADEVWLITALLHSEHPERPDFSVSEIIGRAVRENLSGEYRPGIQVHASTHCVAGKMPNPAAFRMLTETARGRRRLFRPGDPVHAGRIRGKIRPDREDVPKKFLEMLDWYDQRYTVGKSMAPMPKGTSGNVLLKFAGQISRAEAREMEESIRSCEKVDQDGW